MNAKSTQVTKTAEAKTDKTSDSIKDRLNTVRDTTTNVTGALSNGGRAYISGMNELGKVLFGFSKEVFDEGFSHAKATMQAKSLRDVAELQAVYAQNRIETAAAHAQEFVELTKVKTEEVIEPLTALAKTDKAA